MQYKQRRVLSLINFQSLRIYTRNTVFLLFSCRFSGYLNICKKAENWGLLPVSEMCLWLVFFELYEKTWSRLHMVYTKIRIGRFL